MKASETPAPDFFRETPDTKVDLSISRPPVASSAFTADSYLIASEGGVTMPTSSEDFSSCCAAAVVLVVLFVGLGLGFWAGRLLKGAK